MLTDYAMEEKMAIQLMKEVGWDINNAMDFYFRNQHKFNQNSSSSAGGASSSKPNRNSVKDIFKIYEDPDDKGNIGIEGIIKLIEDLEFDPENRTVLILAWRLNAQTQGKFTYEEFNQGLNSLGVDSIAKLSKKLTEIDSQIDSNREEFKDMYKFTFDYAKEPTKKSLDALEAIGYWKLLFQNKDQTFKLRDDWLEFIDQKHGGNELKVISRDQWNLLVDFAEVAVKLVQEYDPCSAWPVLIDEFTEWYQEKHTKMAIG